MGIARTIEASSKDLLRHAIRHLLGWTGKESVSYVHKCLGQDGWKGLGNLADFEVLVRSLGFSIQHGKNGRGQNRKEVTL